MRSRAISSRRLTAIATLTALLTTTAAIAAAPASAAPKDKNNTGISVLDYSQCANGSPPSTSTECENGWINGILQASNAHFAEDQVTPQRAVFRVPKGSPATGRTLSFSYQARKGSAGSHAYDSLATWNATVTDADRCQGLKGNTCPGGPASTFAIPSDPTEVLPVGDGVDPATSAHQLAGVMTMYGATLTGITYGDPAHTAPTEVSTDDYATIQVEYALPDDGNGAVASDTVVQLLFGGHLAASGGPRGWGAGLGSSNISGGPYHIKWTAADGASVGSRDNQIKGADIQVPDLIVSKSASPNPAALGQTVTYTITVENPGGKDVTSDVTDSYTAAHLDVLDATISDGGSDDDAGTITWTGITFPASTITELTYQATVVGTFTDGDGTQGCEPGQFPVPNTVTLTAPSNAPVTNVLCVTVPDLEVSKTATPNPAAIGEVVTYQITVTNTGTGSVTTDVTDDYDLDHLDVDNASITGGGTDDDAGRITWTGITVDEATSVNLTYTATVIGPFTGTPGGEGCEPQQFRVLNTATVTFNGASDTNVLCVGEPDLTLVKSASDTTVDENGSITYTLTYGNDGGSTATDVTISETLPAGTSFDGCTGGNDEGGCTVDGSDITYDVGDVAPGGGGAVTLTVIVDTANAPACTICNIAHIGAANASTESSNEVCVNVTPAPDPDGANSYDNALGASAYLELAGTPVVDESFAFVESEQHGIGSDSANDEVLNVSVPAPDGSTLLSADVIRTTSTSTVVGDPTNEARHVSTAEALNVEVLEGVVTASAVRGVATTIATGGSASWSAAGSVLEELMIDTDGPDGPNPPELFEDVQPGLQVDLDPDVFGPGSLVSVMLNNHDGSTSTPPFGTLSGGTYAADLTVTMIQVDVTNFNGLGPVQIIVSKAIAHSDFPQTSLCSTPNAQKVSGHAFVLSEQTDPTVLPILWGHVAIDPTGGTDAQSLNRIDAGPIATSGKASTESTGSLGENESTASSYAEVSRLCLLEMGDCTISARALRSQSNSAADGSGATSDDLGTEFLGLTVAGNAFGAQPGVNTVVNLDGLGFVVLNQQFCDGGGAPACGGATASGQTVWAINIVITVPDNPLGLSAGAQIIASGAHSDASFA